MGSVFSGAVNPSMLAQYPGASQGMADMAEEMSKLKGTPVEQVMRMGMTSNGQTIPAASEAPLPSGPAAPSAGDVAKESAASSIADKLGGFGGFGGFGHKKKAEDQQAPANAASGTAAQPAYSVLMETNTQMGGFSRTANEASFAIPAGFRQVPMREVKQGSSN
jgi:hypothetical protein